MYKLPYYNEKDQDKVIAFMKENSFAVITGFGKEYPVATHVPLDIRTDEEGRLIFTGHIMKASDHCKAFMENDHVLVIFHGPHTYVSASWYKNPNIASTWDYITVHAKGRISFMDEIGTYDVIKAITEKYEAASPNPSLVEKMPEEYIRRNISMIVGFEIKVEHLDNVFKLSQNRDEESKKNIVKELNKREDQSSKKIATEIEKRIEPTSNSNS